VIDFGYTIEPFNMRREKEEGHFDDAGMYIEHKEDQKKLRDAWLDTVDAGDETAVFSSKQVKKLSSVQRKLMDEKLDEQGGDDDDEDDDVEVEEPMVQIDLAPLTYELLLYLLPTETPMQALRRLKKGGGDVAGESTKDKFSIRKKKIKPTEEDASSDASSSKSCVMKVVGGKRKRLTEWGYDDQPAAKRCETDTKEEEAIIKAQAQAEQADDKKKDASYNSPPTSSSSAAAANGVVRAAAAPAAAANGVVRAAAAELAAAANGGSNERCSKSEKEEIAGKKENKKGQSDENRETAQEEEEGETHTSETKEKDNTKGQSDENRGTTQEEEGAQDTHTSETKEEKENSRRTPSSEEGREKCDKTANEEAGSETGTMNEEATETSLSSSSSSLPREKTGEPTTSTTTTEDACPTNGVTSSPTSPEEKNKKEKKEKDEGDEDSDSEEGSGGMFGALLSMDSHTAVKSNTGHFCSLGGDDKTARDPDAPGACADASNASVELDASNAKTPLERLTEICDMMLQQQMYDVYTTPREEFVTSLLKVAQKAAGAPKEAVDMDVDIIPTEEPSEGASAAAAPSSEGDATSSSAAQAHAAVAPPLVGDGPFWQYKVGDNKDLHGPFESVTMLSWVQHFAGLNVQVRSASATGEALEEIWRPVESIDYALYI